MKIYKSEDYIEAGKRIGIFARVQSAKEEYHCHEFIEVVYVQAGSATQWVDDAHYEVSRGDVVFINYGARHAFEPHGDFCYVNVSFMPEVLSNAIITPDNAIALLSLTAFDEIRREKNGGKLSFSGEERQEIEFVLACMEREYASGLPLSEKVVENYLGILFSKMLRKILLHESSLEIRSVWEELKAYIDQNLHEELTLSALAKRSFYNPSYFSRIFKQKFGASLSDYVRQKRMEQAMLLLRETALSVDDIIDQTGYRDRSAFYHAFSRAAGMAPAEYRARQNIYGKEKP